MRHTWPWVIIAGAALAVAGQHPAAPASAQQPPVPAPTVAPAAVPALAGPLPAQPVTPTTWAQAFLVRMGDPQSPANIHAVVSWEAKEGGHWHNTAAFNPLNTTQPMPGAPCMNSVCVRVYRSWDEGLRATWIVIHNGFYPGILAALADGTSAAGVANAVAASPWGTGWFPT